MLCAYNAQHTNGSMARILQMPRHAIHSRAIGRLMDNVLFIKGKISRITINRPERHNSLDAKTLGELTACVGKASADKSCRSIIITGAGGKAFSAGADIGYISGISSKAAAEKFFGMFYAMRNSILKSPKLVVAAINGYCLGGGNELAMACDIRIASEDATFGQPEVKLGIVPGGGATYALGQITGVSMARELILTGRSFDAKEALRIGLVSRVLKKEALDSEAIRICKEADSCGPDAIALAKDAINKAYEIDCKNEEEAFVKAVMGKEGREGIKAFLQHRKAYFADEA